MAVTIENEPEDWQTSDNPIIYQFSSDEAGEVNFSFKVELKMDGQVVFTDKVFVEVADNAHFDASRSTRFLTPRPNVNTGLTSEAGTTNTIQLVVTENYGSPPQDEASASSFITNVFKGSVSDRDYLEIEYGDYELTKWFTDNPTNDLDILRNETKTISMLGGGNLADATMNFYDENDVLLHTYTTPTENYKIWQININTSLLTFVVGVPDPAAVAYFTVQINSSEVLTLRYYDDACFAPVSVRWVNRYGAYDSFVFKHVNIENGTIDASNYESQFGGWYGGSYSFLLEESGVIDYFKRNNGKGRAVTDYLSQQIQNWLTSIFSGLRHQMTLEDGTTYPIRVTSRSYQKEQARFTDLRALEIKYDIANMDNSLTL